MTTLGSQILIYFAGLHTLLGYSSVVMNIITCMDGIWTLPELCCCCCYCSVDEEEFGGLTELIFEGLMGSFAIFMVSGRRCCCRYCCPGFVPLALQSLP
jgi:hypothetical protein